MPEQYTGNSGGAQPPDPGPAPGRNPIILIPDRNNPNPTEVFRQNLRDLADYVAYFMAQINPSTPLAPPFFGDGSDGALTVSSLTTFTGQTLNFTNLTISAGGILNSVRSIIRVNGTLTIDPAGLIHDNGLPGFTGISGANVTDTGPSIGGIGTDGLGGSVSAPCPLGGGTSGGAGGAGTVQQTSTSAQSGGSGVNFAIDGSALGMVRNSELAYAGYSAKGGAGGMGAPGTSGAGASAGAAGGSAAAAADLVSADLLALTPLNILASGFIRRARYIDHGSGDKGTISELVPLRGGMGGAGGGGQGAVFGASGLTRSDGGSGGAGGGVVMIFANKVILGSSSCIQAKGGNGSSPSRGSAYYYNGDTTDGGGGSGGGGGGRVLLFHGGLIGAALDAGNTVSGGRRGFVPGNSDSSGTGSGTAGEGTDGDPGTLYVRKVW